MVILQGLTVSTGVAMGTAVIVGVDGRPVLSDAQSRQALDALKRDSLKTEWPQVILVAYNAASVLDINIPGMSVVGVMGQSEEFPPNPPKIPCIIGVEGLFREVESGVVVILDATHGAAYIEPDVQTVVAFQSPQRRRPKERRFFVDFDHIPASTLDGRKVEVWGYATTVAEAELSVKQGADGVFFEINSQKSDDIEALFKALHGTQVMFSALLESDALCSAIRCSIPGQIHFALKCAAYSSESAVILTAYSDAEDELELEQEEVDRPAFAVIMTPQCEFIPEVDSPEIGILIHEGAIGPPALDFVREAHMHGRLAFGFGQATGEDDAQLIEAGFDGIIVAADFVGVTKNLITTLPRGLLPIKES